MKKLFLILLILLFITSCASQADRRQNQLYNFRNACVNYGYIEGTTDFANCMMQQDQQSEQQRQALIRQLMQNNQNQQIVVPRPPVRTNCYTNGTYTNCTSQ
jgi:PBP1b-binding outer membrane lipoprotein LpoB